MKNPAAELRGMRSLSDSSEKSAEVRSGEGKEGSRIPRLGSQQCGPVAERIQGATKKSRVIYPQEF